MKVIVFGGAGDMGGRAVEDLATAADVERVTIADRNAQAAGRLAQSLRASGAPVDFKTVDATDHPSIVEAMRGYDVVASALGPFFRFEAALVRAAIEAGVDYASICDDWSAAETVLTEFDQPARQAGRIVVTGLGTSPGLTNVIIRHLSQKLDRVRGADVSVYQPLTGGGGEAVLRHMFYITSGDVAAWRGARQVMVPASACSEERTVEFPRFGPLKVWIMGHTEPVTVPRFFPGIEECNFFMGFGRGSGVFVWLARRGLLGKETSANWAVRFAALGEGLTAGRQPSPGAIRVDVWGDRNGEEVRLMACGVGTMREATALSLSAGVQLLARKQLTVREGGAYAPEACIDPETFVGLMRGKGLEAYEDLAMATPLS